MKKILNVLLVFFILFIIGCKKEDKKIVVTTSLEGKPVLVGDNMPTFPLTKTNEKLNVAFVNAFDGKAEDIFVFKKYEEMTGVKIDWTTVSKKNRDEMLSSILINKQQMDLLLCFRADANNLIAYSDAGYLLDLMKDNMLEKYAPNCYAYLQSHPDTLASIMNPDGSIYSLPQVNSGPELRVSRKIFINKNWLERVDKDIPKTTDEFYELLKAFKEQDANGNGDLNDEIPLCTQDWSSIYESFYGFFGLGTRGVHNLFIDADEDGKARFIAASSGYKEFLQYCNKLYNEQLLDNSIFNITLEQWNNHALNDRIGVFISTNLASLPVNSLDNWVAIDWALTGPNDDNLYSAIRANFHSVGAAMIPSTCKNPKLVLKWLDYFWTDEGTLFYHLGIEGETFSYDEEKGYDYLPYIYEKMKNENKTFDQVISKYTPYPGGKNPTVEIAPYFKGGETVDIPANAARSLINYGPLEYWPNFTFTVEENEILVNTSVDINKYIETSRKKFVTGEESFDNWDKYLQKLIDYGQEDILRIYQNAIDRYEQMKKE